MSLPLEALRPLMSEYMDTIVEMSKLVASTNSPRLEALDIAKRLSHDEGGDTVVSLLGALAPGPRDGASLLHAPGHAASRYDATRRRASPATLIA